MTPPYMLVMATFVYLYTYLGRGPMWPETIGVADSCRMNWWKNILYINNLVGVDGVAPDNQVRLALDTSPRLRTTPDGDHDGPGTHCVLIIALPG